LDAEEDGGYLLCAYVRYVKVTMEGDPNDLFDGPGSLCRNHSKSRTKSGEIPVHDDFSMTMSKMELFNLTRTSNNQPVMSLEEIK
jgi:hypothetical protein